MLYDPSGLRCAIDATPMSANHFITWFADVLPPVVSLHPEGSVYLAGALRTYR